MTFDMSLTLVPVIVNRKGSVGRVQGLLVTDTLSLHTGFGLHTELVKVILETLRCRPGGCCWQNCWLKILFSYFGMGSNFWTRRSRCPDALSLEEVWIYVVLY